jgi:hypothetical protein
MSVFVDDAAVPYRGKPRYHLAADSVQELHAFARRVGIKRCWFHRGARWAHYDITAKERDRALAAGADALTSRELVRRARALRTVTGSASDAGQGDLSFEA